MANKKKPFSVASLDASKLKDVQAPIVPVGSVTTFPKSGETGVSRDATLMVYFHEEEIDHKTVEGNIHVETVLGERVPVKTRITLNGDVALNLQTMLEPNTKYYFKFGNKMRNKKGKKITVSDNSMFFITGK